MEAPALPPVGENMGMVSRERRKARGPPRRATGMAESRIETPGGGEGGRTEVERGEDTVSGREQRIRPRPRNDSASDRPGGLWHPNPVAAISGAGLHPRPRNGPCKPASPS